MQGEPEAEGCRVEGLEGLVQEGCPRLRCTECREKGGQGGGLPGCVLCGRCLCCCLLFSCCLSREREVFVCCLTAVVGFVRAGLLQKRRAGAGFVWAGVPPKTLDGQRRTYGRGKQRAMHRNDAEEEPEGG